METFSPDTLGELTGSELRPPGTISLYGQMGLEGGRYTFERIE
jgi:hypothetical protein